MIGKILKEVHESYAQREQKQTTPVDWWRSSSLGSCRRGQMLARLFAGADVPAEVIGVEDFDQRTMNVFEYGHIIEEMYVAKLRLHPDWVIIEQGEMYSPRWNIKGHFDVLCINKKTGEAFLSDFKSKNSGAFTYMCGNRNNKAQGASHHQKLQVLSYMMMINEYGFSLPDSMCPPIGSTYATEDFPIHAWLMSNAKIVGVLNRQDGTPKERWQLDKTLTNGSLYYISKDDQRTVEYAILADDTRLIRDLELEINELNDAWNNQRAPQAYPKTEWQTKYCRFCNTKLDKSDPNSKGLCENLEDPQVVKDLFKLVAENRKGSL